MKEHPIIFTGNSVRAMMTCSKCGALTIETECPKCGSTERLKTQTRRIIKPQPTLTFQFMGWNSEKMVAYFGHAHAVELEDAICCPYGKPGDEIWIKETWMLPHDMKPVEPRDKKFLIYRADRDGLIPKFDLLSLGYKWRSPLFMPRRASRLSRTLTGVRVESVQDISEADAKAEGIEPSRAQLWIDGGVEYSAGFASVWNSLHQKPKPAKRNPFTGKPELCKVAYPWESVRETTTITTRKSSRWYGMKVYIIGNPWIWVLNF